jgi:NAD(P)-dependent dehydrogenase (short-subunit alcohol dehydrogenase family)
MLTRFQDAWGNYERGYASMATLITGGAGFIGLEVVRLLVENGESRPVIFSRNPVREHLGDLADRVDIIRGDLGNFSHVLHAVKQARPKEIYHLGGMLSVPSEADPAAAFQTNAAGTFHVLEAARLFEVPRVIFASSGGTYGLDIADDMIRDTTIQRPQLFYGATKVFVDKKFKHFWRRPAGVVWSSPLHGRARYGMAWAGARRCRGALGGRRRDCARHCHIQRGERHLCGTHVASETPRHGVGLGERVCLLASTGRGNRRWDGRELEMSQDPRDHRLLIDDGNDAERAPAAPGTGGHIQVKHPLEQPCPAPARHHGARLRLVEALLTGRRDDRPTQMAVRRQTAAIAHQVDVRQGDQRRQLLQEFQWREANPRGPIRPRMGERVDEIAVGVLCQAC